MIFPFTPFVDHMENFNKLSPILSGKIYLNKFIYIICIIYYKFVGKIETRTFNIYI